MKLTTKKRISSVDGTKLKLASPESSEINIRLLQSLAIIIPSSTNLQLWYSRADIIQAVYFVNWALFDVLQNEH